MMNRTRTTAAASEKLTWQVAACLLSLATTIAQGSDQAPFVVDCLYPGGNILVEKIESNTVTVITDSRNNYTEAYYWNFRVRGAGGRTLKFIFRKCGPVGLRGPAVSLDRGKTWALIWGPQPNTSKSFEYSFPEGIEEVRFCLAVPYQEADLHAFVSAEQKSGSLMMEELCRSRRGRPVELVRVGCLGGTARHRVFVAARHHAVEMMASWVLEGIFQGFLAKDKDGDWLRSNVELAAVPFADKDGVEDGDNGKGRYEQGVGTIKDPSFKVRDHVSYHVDSPYPEVTAIKRFLTSWADGGKLRFVLDLHCPGITRRPDSQILVFPVRLRGKFNWENSQPFFRALNSVQQGPLVFNMATNEAFVTWGWAGGKEPPGEDYPPNYNLGGWASYLPGVRFGQTLEIPYSEVLGVPVTADSARALGRDIARAMRAYLESETAGM